MTRKRRPNITPVVLSQQPRELSYNERRRILDVADAMVYEAGRTTLALALRGSKSQKLARFKVDHLAGYGMYRDLPEAEVLARIDQLVRDGMAASDATSDADRLSLPPEGQTIEGWCLYENDRWDGPCPQERDDHGWVVYRDKQAAFVGLAREMQYRCEVFAAGQWSGENLRCNWYPARVTLFSDGRICDETNSEH